MIFDEPRYRTFFNSLTGRPPYAYQVRLAAALTSRTRNVVVRAPTGAGKTWAVLAPFFYSEWRHRPARLIYALPLRTLAQGIFRECHDAAGRLGLPISAIFDRGREVVAPFVTLQTGEQPDDPFFTRGTIVVTTYDQLLSGLLEGPYGLSDRLHNINAASVVGSVVVFDEFHLMAPRKAFLTAAALLHLFRGFCQSVWMTATATMPLERVLREAVEAESIPGSPDENAEMLASLPSIRDVRRFVRWEDAQLTAECVLAQQPCRSIVLLNTVARAQEMFEGLRQGLRSRERDVPLVLLHSRFFKEDRRHKEDKIRFLFGRGACEPAILVATQVVEAGLDISCDHLHTELCPMNALVQRAGRCARFAGEEGAVHVYSLPDGRRSWLPYGDMAGEDATLTRTRAVLEQCSESLLDPAVAADWVERVHGAEDEGALAEGWWARLSTCIGRIELSAIHRKPVRIADLIRGDDSETVRVVVAQQPPETPATREGLSLRRGSLKALASALPPGGVAWVWDGSDEMPWKVLSGPRDVDRGYVVCLSPQIGAYDSEIGLRLGVPGLRESPTRTPPPRPGYAPLRAEPWVDHARRIAEETEKRLQQEHARDGLVGAGFAARLQLAPARLFEAARACAILHDLGKLQASWQRWAEAWQRVADPEYRHACSLAHTDFDPTCGEDRERQQRLGVARPHHAAASAYYGGALLAQALASVPTEQLPLMAAACAAAVLAHHGGWVPPVLAGDITPLCKGWEDDLRAMGFRPDSEAIWSLERRVDKRGALDLLLRPVTDSDQLSETWPLVAYLTRTLRLADQRATAEGASSD